MRLNGGVIGKSNEPTNRAASGIWSSEEQRVAQLYGKFPRYYEGWDLTYLVNTTPRLLSTTVLSGINTGNGIDFSPDGTRLFVLDGGSGAEISGYSLSTPWDTSTASLSSTLGSITLGQGLALRSDGRVFYSSGTLNPSVRAYTMTTAWAVNTAVAGQFVSIAAQTTDSFGTVISEDGTNMYVVGNSSVIYQYSLSTAWDASSATFLRSLNLVSTDNAMRGIAFKPDGLSMYVVGDTSNTVYRYDLSIAWNISTATAINNYNVSGRTTAPRDIVFKPDGTVMYIAIVNGVQQFNLSTAWDITTSSFNAEAFWANNTSPAAQENATTSIAFKSDGSRIFITGTTNDAVQQMSMVVPWQVGTFTHVSTITAADTGPTGLFFKPDGTRMYVNGNGNNRVTDYLLSTAWDQTTATTGTLTSTFVPDTTDIYFKPDGTKMYTISSSIDTVREYDLSGAWDIHSASLVTSIGILTQTNSSAGLAFSSDGLSMYISDPTSIYKYDLYYPWSISTAVFQYKINTPSGPGNGIKLKSDDSKMYAVSSTSIYEYNLPIPKALRSPGDEGGFFSIGAQEITATGITFSTDGYNMYIIGTTGDDINQYSLSTPWNVTTATFVQLFSVATEDLTPQDVQFKPDGTSMYTIGTTNDNVNQYDLSTPWDISTASFIRSKSIAAQETSPSGVVFKPDGTKMFISGSAGDEVNEYNLSTPWDISTASFVQLFSVVTEDAIPQGMAFRPDGLRMFIVGEGNDGIYQYDLSTPWNIATATYSKKLTVEYLDTIPFAITFKDDGTKIYFIGQSNDTIYELSLG